MYRILERKIDALKKKDKCLEDRKTYDEVFDHNTLLALYKLISSGVIETLEYPISTGKEGNVFLATGKNNEFFAVKIYRVATATYKNLTKYIAGDPRFRNIPRDRRGIIFLWAQKEYKNLFRIFSAGIAAPEPKKLIKNVLVMTYIGSEERAAPMLKDAILSDPKKAFEIILENVKNLYQKAKLVHGDLSEYNILVHDDDYFIIDVGQSVVLEHPLAEELLRRDVANITRFFCKLGVPSTETDVLNYIKEG